MAFTGVFWGTDFVWQRAASTSTLPHIAPLTCTPWLGLTVGVHQASQVPSTWKAPQYAMDGGISRQVVHILQDAAGACGATLLTQKRRPRRLKEETKRRCHKPPIDGLTPPTGVHRAQRVPSCWQARTYTRYTNDPGGGTQQEQLHSARELQQPVAPPICSQHNIWHRPSFLDNNAPRAH